MPLYANALGYVLLFLMLFLPTAYRPVKASILIIVVCAAVGRLATGRAEIDPTILKGTLAYMIIGAGFLLYGTFSNNLGAIANAPLFVIWPAVYSVLIAAASTHRTTPTHLIGVLLAGAAAVEAYALSYVLTSRGLLPDWVYIDLSLGQNIGFYEGQAAFTMFSVSSLVFLVPFLLGIIIIVPPRCDTVIPRWLLYVLAAVGAALAIISARRGLMLAVAVAPFLALALRQSFLPRSVRSYRLPWLSWTIIVVVSAAVGPALLRDLFGIDLAVVYGDFQAALNLTDAPSQLRRLQYEELMAAWSNSPIFGEGLGAHLPHLTVSAEQPWAYELTYVALLFQLGLVGLAAYAGGLVWIVRKSISVARADQEFGTILLPVIVGTLSFMVANATNPYLAKFDYLWVIFLPIGLINWWLVRHRSSARLGVVRGDGNKGERAMY